MHEVFNKSNPISISMSVYEQQRNNSQIMTTI